MISIYFIESKTTQKVYIGQSIDVKERWSRHKLALRKGEHHCPYLQRAWDKYGAEDFEWYIIMGQLNEDDANSVEKAFIEWFAELELAYNPTWRHKGRGQISQEAKQKLSQRNKTLGIKPPSRLGCTGFHLSEEHKEKLRELSLGKRSPHPCPICGEQCKERTHKGKFVGYNKTCGHRKCIEVLRPKKTTEIREKISQSKKGQKHTTESRQKMSEALKGKKPANLEQIQALRAKDFELISPTGETIRASNLTKFAEQHGLNAKILGRLINKKIDTYKGWKRNEI